MRWLSFFRPRQHRWMPVTNVDLDIAGMDDLMQMAVEDCCLDEEDEPDINSPVDLRFLETSRNRIATDAFRASDFEGPVFSHALSSESLSNQQSTALSHSLPVAPNLPMSSITDSPDHDDTFLMQNESSRYRRRPLNERGCLGKFPQATFPKCRPCFVVLSILVPLLCMGLCAGLGVYSIFVYKTDKLVIDKSVKSFSIPNHKVYKQFEAMMLARRDNSSAGRYKRGSTRILTSYDKNSSGGRTSLPRSRREALLEKESQMIQETEKVLSKVGLTTGRFKRDIRQTDSLSLSAKRQSQVGFFSDALRRIKRRTNSVGCIFEYQSIATWKMHVIYLAHGDEDNNMFTKERLETVHKIEHQIMQHPGFHDFCLRDPNIENYDPAVRSMHGCVPLNSLMTYFYPSKDSLGHIFYDGMGSNIDDIDSALTLAMNHETFYYYVDDKINKTYKKSHLIRSEVLFGAPLQGYSCIGGHKDHSEQDRKFKDFVITYIGLLSAASTEKVHVLYGGKEIFDYEVTTTFWRDIRLATISLVAIFALMLVLTLSLYLTVLGIVIISLSFPISLFFYRVVFEINALGILTGAAVFVIIGIGVDDVFVFVNIYRQAAQISDPLSRIKYTVKTAGVATFFTSFTTAAAFAANLASSIPAVYDFGLFMALIVSSCWVSVFIMMPPLLYFHACCVEPLETLLFSCFSCITKRISGHANSSHSEIMSPLLTTQEEEVGLYQEDDDVPMLDVQGPSDSPDGNDRLLSGVTDDSTAGLHRQEASSQRYISNNITNNNMCLGRIIQKSAMFMTNRIILPGRYFVVGIFVMLLATSCYLMSRLKPSAHPPQLFRSDTNLQRLLDLKANFSMIDTLHCNRCSALYKVPPTPAHTREESLKSLPASVPPPPTADPSMNTPGINHRAVDTGFQTTKLAPHPHHSQHHDHDSHDKPGKLSTPDSPASGSSNTIEHGLSALANSSQSSALKLVAHGVEAFLKLALSSKDSDRNETVVTTALQPRLTEPPTVASVPSHKTTRAPYKHIEHVTKDELGGKGYIVPNPVHYNRGRSPDSKPQSGGSLAENFNVCKEQRCNNLKDRPLMESGTTVYVVFGIAGVDRTGEDEGHVMDLFKGKAIFDFTFANAFNIEKLNVDHVKELCRVCHILSNMTELVKKGSAQCLPSVSSMNMLLHFLSTIDECKDLPGSLSIYHHQAPAHAEGGIDHTGRLLWLAFAFESTTKEGLAYSKAYKQYLQWEKVIQHIKQDVLAPNSPLHSIFQTSEFWTKVMMEVVAVNSAIYGLVLSMVICIISVAIFTGHLVLLVIVVVTIMVMICCVVGIFYLAGWEMGAVEAVSLSILVGSSVDYCVHIVEGYILAGRRMDSSEMKLQSAQSLRRLRTSQAVRHIGVAIVCSGLTTIIAAIPLTQTYIQPFTKFGSILLINTSISMLLTLTLATALLAIFAPARFRATWKSHLIAFGLVVVLTGLAVLGLYILSKSGIDIPGPSGSSLFS